MTRRNISLPEDLDQRARDAGLNVSALARDAILIELDRRTRMASLDAWLDALDAEHGPPSERAMRAARKWAGGSRPVLAAESSSAARVSHPKSTRARPTSKQNRRAS